MARRAKQRQVTEVVAVEMHDVKGDEARVQSHSLAASGRSTVAWGA
jgi:hypothetical protein